MSTGCGMRFREARKLDTPRWMEGAGGTWAWTAKPKSSKTRAVKWFMSWSNGECDLYHTLR